MKKSNFMALILGVIGGVFFALGMCMSLLPEWNMHDQGIVCGVIGVLILLADVFIWRKMEGKKPIRLSGKTIGAVALSVVGALLLGVGMCLTMLSSRMVVGIVVGLSGIVMLLMLIPLLKGLK